MTIKKLSILLLHAFIGWVLCAATIYVGRSVTSMQTTLIIHVIAAPIYFVVLSWVFFTRFNYTRPLQTALIFMGFIITGDFFIFASWSTGAWRCLPACWAPGSPLP